jgi:hypothetical protein
MAKTARVSITNVYADGGYTARILVGSKQQPMNVLLDTGSSMLTLDGSKYQPNLADGDQSTDLAQTESYGDGTSFTGAVITTQLSIGDGDTSVDLQNGNAAIAYIASSGMFGGFDGILGLAYAPLDFAFTMPTDTWAHKYSEVEVRSGQRGQIKPYLTQLADEGVVSDIIAFLTRRSNIHVGSGQGDDPLNQGLMIVGGGEESTDLYTGSFQTVKVLADDWYNTNLKAVIVGSTDPIVGSMQVPKGMPSNSIVDSGTNSLNLSDLLLKALLSKFSTAQQELLAGSIYDNKLVSATDLNLDEWPTLTFVLQGDEADVSLQVSPSNYWQVDAPKVGAATAAISKGYEPGLATLGLPLMNGYFTIFDGEADAGRGVIKFATRTA